MLRISLRDEKLSLLNSLLRISLPFYHFIDFDTHISSEILSKYLFEISNSFKIHISRYSLKKYDILYNLFSLEEDTFNLDFKKIIDSCYFELLLVAGAIG